MTSRIGEIVLNARDPEQLAEFWCAALGYVVLDRDEGAVEIGHPSGFGGVHPTLLLSPADDPHPVSLRLHLDLNPVDGDQDTELARLLALGATPADIGQTGQESWHVLADPEGNVFCLLRRRLDPLPPVNAHTG